jgi:Holliday junction resolvase RusA-like endonuclease
LSPTALSTESRHRLTFDVPGIPAPQGSLKAIPTKGGGVNVIHDQPRLKDWRSLVAYTAYQHWRWGMTAGPVALRLEFRLPVLKSAPKRRRIEPISQRNDVDKLARGVLDSLTGIVYGDDAQVTELHATKQYAYDDPPGLTVTVEWTPKGEV